MKKNDCYDELKEQEKKWEVRRGIEHGFVPLGGDEISGLGKAKQVVYGETYTKTIWER
jgi:hypothetical protein